MARRLCLVMAALGFADAKITSFRGLGGLPSRVPGRMLQMPVTINSSLTTMPPTMPSNSGDSSFVYGQMPIVFSPTSSVTLSLMDVMNIFGPVVSASNVSCGSLTTCISASYNASNMSTSYSVTCVSDTSACACGDSGSANLCTATIPDLESETPSSAAYCVPRSVQQCPQFCANPCLSFNYDNQGKQLGMSSMTCDKCNCNPDMENTCSYQGTNFCLAKAFGSCPLDCGAGTTCTSFQYNKDGSGVVLGPNGSPLANYSCAVNGVCPCAAQEQSCTNSGSPFCLAPFQGGTCPLDCGLNSFCISYNGTMSCPNAQGCVCDPDHEIGCPDGNNMTQCFDKMYYTSCPLVCTGSQASCPTYAFNPDGTSNVTQSCRTVDSGDCPTLCDSATADVCGDPTSMFSYCAPKGQCPPASPTCTAGQQLCFGQNASIPWYLDAGVCLTPDAFGNCPCPPGSPTCIDSNGMPFCAGVGGTCPLNCGDPTVNQTCTVLGFLPDGSLDDKSLNNQVCASVNATCPCGTNAVPCSYKDPYGLLNVYCLPTVVDGIATQCPVTCTESQQLCIILNYDMSGNYAGYSQNCAAQTANCGPGNNTLTCSDEFGNPYYLPLYDSTGKKQPCPVVCNATTENTCNTPIFDATTGSVTSVSTVCVKNGQPCPCPSVVPGTTTKTNAAPCNYTNPDGSIYTDCIPSVYKNSWCPAQCPAGQVACPAPTLYNPDGSYFAMGDTYCANSTAACGCGGIKANAQSCMVGGQAVCYPTAVPCPLTCAADQQLCYVTNYNTTGGFVSEKQQCMSANATCPCGQNAVLPPGGGACMSTTTAAVLSPCGPDKTKDLCWVEDFDTKGVSVGKNPRCVTLGDQCPCGKNAKTCPDPNDATQNICVPQSAKDGSTSCPTPCTPAQEAKNLSTCVQTNLDKTGKYVSTSVSCVPPGACEPGTNQKVCPSGAMIFTGDGCNDIYGAVGSNSSSLGMPAGSSQESNLVFSLDAAPNVTADALGSAGNNVQCALNSVLQIGSDLQLDVTLVGQTGTGRRLQANSKQPVKKIQAVVTVKSTGKSKVAPSVVAAKAKTLTSSGSASMNKAFGSVGKPNPKAGVSAATSTKVVVTRAATASAPPKAMTAGATTVAPGMPTTAMVQVITTTQKKVGASGSLRAEPMSMLFSFVLFGATYKLLV